MQVTDYKNLFRKLEKTLASIERTEDLSPTLTAVLERLVHDFRDDLGLVGGRIYVRSSSAYVLEREIPEGRAPRGFRIPVSYPPIRELLERGYVLHRVGDPGVDAGIEEALGVEVFAAIGVGEDAERILAFTLRPGSDPGEIRSLLETMRHVLNLKFRKERLEDRLEEARAIQLSLLPSAAPAFGDFDLWASTVPAEEVGGDLYDFIEVGPRSLGIVIADASGHGLPAALQARDVIIGLRMGVEEKLRITASLEKLNRVIHRSALSSRFISVFYGELDRNGLFVFCNAGHAPPIVLQNGRFEELRRGGMVLGPNPDAVYDRGFVRFEPGAILLAYTDGITEAENERGEAFGTERLKRVLGSSRWTSARELVEAVFADVRSFSKRLSPADDQTVLALLRRMPDAA
jgi:sigma-B regulation protein RsbU (phosphoserine phosphatase)